ncbi:YDG domain-containing protein [Flavobacterium luteum]|uniref:T9SS type A sorting domain-containing protein n=1 Tax=Flavobacterium luteum TaxID=2026654 RepID=A0A7J5A9S2_9FLAO|nr:YDG domain-containing protein [Flavobacterium luteum]KAB1154297.1 T9SS type A sorting domain-containing protein [Flavobacterium luteum]
MKKLLLLFFLLVYASGFSQPTVMPTTPPTRTASNVLSIYSGAYTNQTGVSYPTFGGATLNADLALPGSPAGTAKSYSAHSFSGIQVNTAGVLDVSGMTTLHLDVYSTNYTSLAVKLESSTTTARELTVTGSTIPSSTTRNQWISLDLDLSTYNTGNILSSLKYIVPVTFGQNATLFITNVYFYKPELLTGNMYINDGTFAAGDFCTAAGQDIAGNDGTSAKPFATLAYALSRSSQAAGTIFYIDAGTYSWSTVHTFTASGTLASPITIQGKGNGSTIITSTAAANSGLYFSTGNYWTVKDLQWNATTAWSARVDTAIGITLQNCIFNFTGTGTTIQSVVMANAGGQLAIKNCTLSRNNTNYHMIEVVAGTSLTLQDNTIRFSAIAAVGTASSVQFAANAASVLIMERNKLYGGGYGVGFVAAGTIAANASTIIKNNFFSSNWGIVNTQITGLKVYNNSFYTADNCLYAITPAFMNNWDIQNNVLYTYGAAACVLVNATTAATMNYNHYYYPSGTGAVNLSGVTSSLATWKASGNPLAIREANGQGGAVLANNPLYVNIASLATNDLHLQTGSPAIAVGNSSLVIDDIDGTTRPLGGTYEIGADEFCSDTITLSSAAGTNAQTISSGAAITNITYTTSGATGATVTGLPTGVTSNWLANVLTINGTPTSAGGTYTVSLTGGCGITTTTGTITVLPQFGLALGYEVGETGGYTGIFGGMPVPTLVTGTGTNTTRVQQIVTDTAQQVWQGEDINLTKPVDLTVTKTMSIDVYASGPMFFLVKVKGGTGTPAAIVSYTGTNTWQTCYFTFGTALDSQAATATGVYTGFVIHPYWETAVQTAFGTLKPARTIIVDNIRGTLAPQLGALALTSKIVGDTAFTVTQPTSNNVSGAFTYTSATPGVATINSSTGLITIFGAGTSVITATQAAANGYVASSVSATLTVTAAPSSYTWGGTNSAWTTAASWTPTRTTPAINDILTLPSGTYTITAVPTQTIGRLIVNAGANATLQTSAAGTLTMTDGTAADELSIASTGSLFVSVAGANNNGVGGLTLAFGTSSTATVAGRLEITNNCGCANPIKINTTNCVMTVTGTLAAGGTLDNDPWTTSASSLLIANAGTFECKYSTNNLGRVPTAGWQTGSLCSIIGNVSVPQITGLGQNFYNLTWNCPSQTLVGFNLNTSSAIINVSNEFKVISTGATTGSLTMGNGTINTKDFTQTGGAFEMNTATGTSTMNVTGTFNQTAGTFQSSNLGTPLLSFNGTTTQNVNFFNAAPTGSGLTYRVNNVNGINLTGSGTLTTNFNINATGGVRVSSAATAPITSTLTLVYAVGSRLTYDGGAGRIATATVFPASNGPLNITVGSGSTLNLNSLNRTVNNLILNVTSQGFSDYGGTGSGATNTTSGFFTANAGILTVTCVLNTVALTSAVGTNAQTINAGNAITTITYATTGATGATITGLPTGLTSGWSGNVVNISGTPTSTAGTYTVTLTGGCGTITTIGSITVNPNSYTWNGNTTDWTVGSNWTPTRTTAAFNDILTFPSGNFTVTNVPTQSIGRLIISAGANVLLQTVTSGKTLTIISDGTATNELSVESLGSLKFNSTGFGIALEFTSGSTALIDGVFEIDNTTATNSINLTNCVMTVSASGTLAGGSIWTNNPWLGTNTSSLLIAGTYRHKYTTNQGFLPYANWQTGSITLISGTTSTANIGSFNQTFNNLTWNCPSQTSNLDFGITGFVGTTNTFTVTSTGTGSIILNKTITVKDFTQTGGTVDFSTGTAGVVNVSGNFSQTAGTIKSTSASGTINFNGTTQTYTSGGTLANAINHSIANGATVDFGTSVISSGSTGTFNLASGGKIITANANGLTASGASGTVQSSGTRTYNSGASYEFKGANTGNFNLSTANTITGTLKLNSATGNINANQSLATSNLDITNNVVTTGANTITLDSGGSYSRTTGYVNGNFKKFIAASSTSRTFEIGNATNYLPLTLNFTGTITAGGSITASTTDGDHPQIVSSSINSNKSVNRYFTVTNSPAVPGLTSYNPDFLYLVGDNDGSATPANYGIQTYNGSAWASSTVSGTPTSTTATATGVTTFGDFAIGESKTTPTVTVNVGTYTYNTASQGPNSISVITPAPASVTYSYTGVSLTYGPTATPPTKAGSYTATATVVEDANYPTTSSAPTAFVIGQAELTVTGATSQDKEYNTTDTAIITGGSLVGVIGSDDVLLVQKGTFPSKNVGDNLVVTPSCSLAGTEKDNYFLTQPSVNTASITPKVVTINNLATADKVYDKTNTAIISVVPATELQGEFPSDTANLSFTPSGYYADANVGNWTITSTTELTGSEKDNYILSQPVFSTKKDITPVGLDVTGITADNKTYDGNTDAVINTGGATLSGILSGEEAGVTLDTSLATGSFITRDFGTGKTVTIAGLSISGANASNYSINTTTTTANIDRRPITITATDQIKCAGGAFSSPGNLNVDFTKDYNIAGDIVSVTLTVIGGDGSISGSYPVRPSLPVPGASNYIVTPVDGVLTVNPSPTATVTGTVATCIGSAPLVTFTGALGAGTTGLGGTLQYEFTYKIGAGGTPTTITTNPGSASTFIVASTNVSGAINYILLGVRDIVSGCSQAQAGTATVTTGICTQLRAAQCGQFVPAADTVIQANPVPGATQYRFEITLTTAPNTVTVYTWPNYYFNPTTVLGGGLAYGKEYNIRVKPFIGATEYPYGGVCLIKAPLVAPAASATTTVRPFQCGKTLATINTFIEASPVVTATLYEFEVTDGSGTRFTTSTLYYFNPMTGILGGVQYDTPYSIRVRTFTGVNRDIPLTPWGAACTVTTPGLPFSKLVTTQCNKTVTSLTPRLNAASIFLADGYRFRVRLQSNPLISRVVEKTSGNMTVLTAAELPGGYAAGTTYLVDVAVRYSVSGQWQESYGGDICTITTPIARMNETQVDNIFNVKSFPNPFASHFNLDIESSSDAQVEMKVYDMIGRQLEVRKASVSELSVLEIGRNYPTGIYNVIVSQGQKVKSLRMIKR